MPSLGSSAPSRKPAWLSRTPLARRTPRKQPGPRLARSAPTRTRCWSASAPTATALRADLRARAERQADAYREVVTQLRAGTSHDTGTLADGKRQRHTP
jgi:hypothetical protein